MSKEKRIKTGPVEIDVDQIDMELMKERTTDLPGLIAYAHSIGGFSIVPNDEGMVKSEAMNAMKDQTNMQMNQIYEQMQLLASQAAKIKRRAEISIDIYEAEIKFKPVINKIYFLYKKSEEKNILSMIHPKEWGEKMPFQTFLAEVKLMADHTWLVIEDAKENQ